jgi:hypothetical protein
VATAARHRFGFLRMRVSSQETPSYVNNHLSTHTPTYLSKCMWEGEALGSVVVRALCCKQEGRVFETR